MNTLLANTLRETEYFSEKYIIQNADGYDWVFFSSYCDVSKYSIDFFQRFKLEIDFSSICWFNKPDALFLETFMDDLCEDVFYDFYDLHYEYSTDSPEYISILKKIRKVFLDEYSYLFDWEGISAEFPFTLEEIHKWKDKINFYEIITNDKINHTWLLEFEDYIVKEINTKKDKDFTKIFASSSYLCNYSKEYYEFFLKIFKDLDMNVNSWDDISMSIILHEAEGFIKKYEKELNLKSIINRITRIKLKSDIEEKRIKEGTLDESKNWSLESTKKKEGYYISDEFVKDYLIITYFEQKLVD